MYPFPLIVVRRVALTVKSQKGSDVTEHHRWNVFPEAYCPKVYCEAVCVKGERIEALIRIAAPRHLQSHACVRRCQAAIEGAFQTSYQAAGMGTFFLDEAAHFFNSRLINASIVRVIERIRVIPLRAHWKTT